MTEPSNPIETVGEMSDIADLSHRVREARAAGYDSYCLVHQKGFTGAICPDCGRLDDETEALIASVHCRRPNSNNALRNRIRHLVEEASSTWTIVPGKGDEPDGIISKAEVTSPSDPPVGKDSSFEELLQPLRALIAKRAEGEGEEMVAALSRYVEQLKADNAQLTRELNRVSDMVGNYQYFLTLMQNVASDIARRSTQGDTAQ